MRAFVFVALLACLSILPVASAVLVEMPLNVTPDRDHAEVGDEVEFTATLANSSWREDLAGRTFRVEATYDGGEDGATPAPIAVGNVTLDADASGTFRWTIPASVDDKNVFVTILRGEDGLGSAHVPVGDAPPIMFATGGGPADSGPSETTDNDPSPETGRGIPGPAAALVLVVLGALAWAARRR